VFDSVDHHQSWVYERLDKNQSVKVPITKPAVEEIQINTVEAKQKDKVVEEQQ